MSVYMCLSYSRSLILLCPHPKSLHTQVPNVFVKAQHLGGCDDTLAAIRSGKISLMLKEE